MTWIPSFSVLLYNVCALINRKLLSSEQNCSSRLKHIHTLTTANVFSYIMATSFSGGRSQSTQGDQLTMGKQLVIFITCGCESSAPLFVICKVGCKPMPYW
jgi:hypothetical protein